MERFNNILIVLLLGIVVLLFIKSERKCPVKKEQFSVNEDMNSNESQKIMNACRFSLDCCPSMYSNDRGCMCMGAEEEEILVTRGYNRTSTDGFGY